MVEVNFDTFLRNKGFYFNKEIIENFLLSLKVNPFIILSGGSGLGKTKLPQLFAQYLAYDEEYYTIKVSTLKRSYTGGKADKQVGWSVRKKYLKNVLPIDIVDKKYEVEIGGFVTEANFSLLIQLYYDYNNDDLKNYFKKLYNEEKLIEENDKLMDRKHIQQMVELNVSIESLKNLISKDYSTIDEIVLHPSLTEDVTKGKTKTIPFEIFDYLPFYKKTPTLIYANNIFSSANFKLKLRMGGYGTPDIKNYLKKLYDSGEENFELKIRGFKHNFIDFQPDYTNVYKKSHEIVPVAVNWFDSSHIIGYYNAIIDEYEFTPTFKLIKKAQKEVNNPYFIILDEMNLSSVDVYFSDFLSAMESGEQIPLYGCTKTLKIPKNIFVVGTVNINENQHEISPKVLDRANVIELEGVSVDNFMSREEVNNKFKGDIGYLECPLSDLNVNLSIDELKKTFLKISCGDSNLWEILTIELNTFQEILNESRFDVSFRVICDILKFMFVAWKYENSPVLWDNWERYFDAQIKQKILSKISGDRKSIEKILKRLFNCCLIEKSYIDDFNKVILKKDCKYYTSALKIQNLTKELYELGHVSFMG